MSDICPPYIGTLEKFLEKQIENAKVEVAKSEIKTEKAKAYLAYVEKKYEELKKPKKK